MSNLVQNQRVSFSGRLGDDPDLRYTPEGKAVTNFSVAYTPRVQQGEDWVDGQTVWYRVAAWNAMAEHVAESLKKGDLVLVLGKQTDREYDKSDGNGKAVSHDVTADHVGPSLKWTDVIVNRIERELADRGAGKQDLGGSAGQGGSGIGI
jgi:single-strand DNA-binding protein